MNPDPSQPQTPAPVENSSPEVPVTLPPAQPVAPASTEYPAAPVVETAPASVVSNAFGAAPVSSEQTSVPSAQPTPVVDPTLNSAPVLVHDSKPKNKKLLILIAVVVVLVIIAIVLLLASK